MGAGGSIKIEGTTTSSVSGIGGTSHGKGRVEVDRISIGGTFVIMWWRETIREAS